jgi:hypothetical protein
MATKKNPKKKSATKKAESSSSRTNATNVSVRSGGTRVNVFNSGLEVWLYDDANLETIRSAATKGDPGAGGMPGGFEKLTKEGLVVGYSLYQDDSVDAEVHFGNAFTKEELAAGRWLEPQFAFLKLPSGALCIESNDASRLGPEEPGDKGAVVKVAPGDYRLTLLRVDHEALDREGIDWTGPQELLLLTPGGNPAEAASYLLPFEHRRDTSWVGQFTIHEKQADALVWFNDYWDTFFVNLDGKACAKLGLTPGRHFRTHVPGAGLTMISVFGPSWDEARRMPPPSNIGLEEYGYAAVITPQDWAPHEALFCRRDSAKARAEDAVHNIWLPATIELLDSTAHPPKEKSPEAQLIELPQKQFFENGFLSMVLSDLLPGVENLKAFSLADAIKRIDSKLEAMDLRPQGDIGWTQTTGPLEEEFGLRLYVGAVDAFAAIVASEGSFEFVFLTELEDGTWAATGITDAIQRRAMRRGPDGIPVSHPKIRLTEIDESIDRILAAHKKAVGKRAIASVPSDLLTAAQAFARFFKEVEQG